MKRILYLDKKSNEIEDLLSGMKNIIVRAANIKKYPYHMIEEGYRLYFVNNNSESIILASALVKKALFIEEPDEIKRLRTLEEYDFRLSDTKMKYIEERKYISIFVLSDIQKEYATFDTSQYGTKDDWLIINNIE